MADVAIYTTSRLLAAALANDLRRHRAVSRVIVASCPEELAEICRKKQPATVLLGMGRHNPDWPLLVDRLRQDNPSVRVVGLACGRETEEAVGDGGGHGLDAVHPVRGEAGELWELLGLDPPQPCPPPPPAEPTPAEPAPGPGRARVLTTRELEVLRAVAAGLTSQAIGARLGISPKTVESHKSRVIAKLGVRNRAQAVALAARRGLLGPLAFPVAIEAPPTGGGGGGGAQ